MPSYIYNATTKELEYVAGGTLYAEMPIGTIVPFGGSTVPDGYELCDGSEVLKTDYPDLYAVIGDSFGTASDNTKFVLPDMRGKVPVGFDSNDTDFNVIGEGGGEKTHLLTIDEIPSHRHQVSRPPATYDEFISGSTFLVGTTLGSPAHQYYTNEIGGSQAHNNLQPYSTVNYIIKALLTGQPVELSINTTDWNTIETLI